MSAQEKVEDSRLLEAISQQLNLYDNLFPKVESKELQVLFALIRIYLARCDNPQLKREHIMINPQLMNRLTLTYFDPFNTEISRGLREALVSRLSSIRKYRVTNPEVVRRALVACLYGEEHRIHKKHKKYLDAFMKNAGKTFTEIAEQLSVSPQAVSMAYNSMEKSDLCKFYGYMNYPAFKLRHFIVFFTAAREYRGDGEFFRRLLFDNLPFTLSLNTDIYEGRSWASFLIPNQSNEIRQFKESLNGLKGEVFRDLSIFELKSFSTGSNLEFFDGKRWFFDPELWSYGFFEFVRENKQVLRKATELRYSSQPIHFDRADYLIASTLTTDALLSHREITERLRGFGYDLSRPSTTRRVDRLTSRRPSLETDLEVAEPALYQCMSYTGLGLSNLSMYLIECDECYVDEMLYAVAYLPYYFLYRTDKGMLLSVKSTSEDVSKFNYMIKGLDKILVLTYSNRFHNMGIRAPTQLHEKWDENKQKWVCASNELDLVTRFESMP
jgi:DNA-binding Lrp family transcriptional regulator